MSASDVDLYAGTVRGITSAFFTIALVLLPVATARVQRRKAFKCASKRHTFIGEGGLLDNTLGSHVNARPKMPRKPGDLAGLKRRLWWAITHCEYILATADTDEKILRTVHALCQTSLAYAKLIELSDMRRRLERLEALSRRNGHG